VIAGIGAGDYGPSRSGPVLDQGGRGVGVPWASGVADRPRLGWRHRRPPVEPVARSLPHVDGFDQRPRRSVPVQRERLVQALGPDVVPDRPRVVARRSGEGGEPVGALLVRTGHDGPPGGGFWWACASGIAHD